MIQIESRNIVDRFRQWWFAGVDLIFPSRCAGCGQLGSVWCQHCKKSLQLIVKPICRTCGVSVSRPVGRCNLCIDYPDGLQVRAHAKYQGPLLRAILHLKYRPNRELARIMTSWLNDHLLKTRVNLIIPVPLGSKRLRSRGYNQAGLLAEGISEIRDLEIRPLSLSRIRETESQVGLDPIARLKNVQDAFGADKGSVEGKRILLVDDLVTTGATMSACARALFDARASSVFGIAVARA